MVQTHTVGDQGLLRIKQMIKIMPLPRQSPLIGWSTLTAQFLILDLFELTWLPLLNRRVSARTNAFNHWRHRRLPKLRFRWTAEVHGRLENKPFRSKMIDLGIVREVPR